MKDAVLELKNIHKSFGDNHIHRGIDLTLYKGENLGLLGGSGTGKSVLLRSIIGLDRIDKGEVLLDGERFDHLSEVSKRSTL
jgi:phospholipid/cholesterol/gamma-HCH transport system ATP-binding protein